MTWTRRQLCRTGAAWGLGAALAPARARARKPSGAPTVDAIVLGAGVSGLNAAWLLEQQGLTVLVLEGRARVGGRVLTLFDQPGLPEMGFASMGAGYGRGLAAAKRVGLELIDVAPRFAAGFKQELVLGESFLSREEWAASQANPFPDGSKAVMPWELVGKTVGGGNPLQNSADWLDPKSASLDVSMHDFLIEKGLSEEAIGLALDLSPYFGSSSRDVSALLYEFNDSWVKSQRAFGPQSFMVQGGNEKLPRAMAAALKGDVLLGKRIVALSSDAANVKVECADGSAYRGKQIVCSLPFSTLRQVKIEPGLTGPLQRAVRGLNYQPISVAYLTVKSPFWEKDGHSPSMWTNGRLGTVMALQLGPREGEVTGLLVQARSGLARYWDGLGQAAAGRMILAELAAIRPASKGLVTVAAMHSWGQERFNLGDWAYFGPGQISDFVKEMALPNGRLHFCGEHTAVSNRGLEGALESSERAAIEVLSA